MAQKLYKPLLIDSITAKAYLPKQRFVGFDGNICAAGAKALGICDVETDANQQAPVAVSGILLIETASAITQGYKICSDSNGKAVQVAGAEEVNGYALDTASNAGDIIRILRV